jgi:D-glycero-alpha-D-manno-heptose-7-phosphate kinase
MILTKTPFRIPLGGGSTDLPFYYQKYGGFIFGCAITLYFKVFLAASAIDDYIHFDYSSYEAVKSIKDLKHNIGREALKIAGVEKSVVITFQSDTPAGTGLGSSGSCAVGLLNALHAFKQESVSAEKLAQEAFQITQNLGWPDGVQDPYLAALGGLTVLEIAKTGKVNWHHLEVGKLTIDKFLRRTLLFYTGVKRDSIDILKEQSSKKVLEIKHRTKKIGRQILQSFLSDNLDDFGLLMDEHWRIKKEMSDKMSSNKFDEIYNLAKAAGALGGKLLGAGGGGYFLFYCPEKRIESVASILLKAGLRQVSFQIDYQGTRFINADF